MSPAKSECQVLVLQDLVCPDPSPRNRIQVFMSNSPGSFLETSCTLMEALGGVLATRDIMRVRRDFTPSRAWISSSVKRHAWIVYSVRLLHDESSGKFSTVYGTHWSAFSSQWFPCVTSMEIPVRDLDEEGAACRALVTFSRSHSQEVNCRARWQPRSPEVERRAPFCAGGLEGRACDSADPLTLVQTVGTGP